jgi:thiol-disulfide isomerase/thioredoxin
MNAIFHRYNKVNYCVTGFPSSSTLLHRHNRNSNPLRFVSPITTTTSIHHRRTESNVHHNAFIQRSPPRRLLREYHSSNCRYRSVSGIIYDVEEDDDTTKKKSSEHNAIVVTLFTKEGCTLCDKVQDVLKSLRSKYPHKLVAIDITDPLYKDQWYEKYKYDIPVLHVYDDTSVYWAKHRITPEQAEQCFQQIQQGIPITPIGTPPNAAQSRPKGGDNQIHNFH